MARSDTAKALGCKVGDIVLLTFTPLGWDNKPFRVISQQINASCQVPLELVELFPLKLVEG